jgi:ribonuclease VapC
MFLDASAIVAILAQESDADDLLSRIESRPTACYYSALSAYESIISLSRILTNLSDGPEAPIRPATIERTQQQVMGFLAVLEAEEIIIGGTALNRALAATRAYGKHVAHPARLNFGDCFAYACAKDSGIPLLFKGNDFSQTDVERA